MSTWAWVVLGLGISFFERRRAKEYARLREIAFRMRRPFNEYEEAAYLAYKASRLANIWDIIFYIAITANMGIGHYLRLFPWQR